jgi:NADH:ubiquinone oxidoreductase subunit 6 (subunit J)
LRAGRYDAAMSVFLTVILVLAMIGVLIALGVGVVTMLKGGNPRRSNKMMQMRVLMQAVALVALALLMMSAASHH